MPHSTHRPLDVMPDKVTLFQSEPGFAIGSWGRYSLAVWRTEISALGVSIWTRAFTQLKQAYPGQRLGLLNWIEPECIFSPESSAFAACVEALRRFPDTLAGSASVYAREGFWNATMRSRVMAVHGESKTEVPFALRPTLSEAYAWLREQAPALPNVALPALEQAMEQLRKA